STAAVFATLDDRVDLYRDLLAERRVSVLLDNAASDAQVVPLIPGGPGCAVIITGRVRIGAALGAKVLGLDVLEPDEAGSLLSQISGPPRVAAEIDAALELCRYCGNLPLAIRVAAAKLAAKPH